MVDRSYMLDRPPPPSSLARFVSHRVFPAAIDAAASAELALNGVASASRQRPRMALGLALMVGWLLASAHDLRRRAAKVAARQGRRRP